MLMISTNESKEKRGCCHCVFLAVKNKHYLASLIT